MSGVADAVKHNIAAITSVVVELGAVEVERGACPVRVVVALSVANMRLEASAVLARAVKAGDTETVSVLCLGFKQQQQPQQQTTREKNQTNPIVRCHYMDNQRASVRGFDEQVK